MSTITNYKKIPKDISSKDDLDFQYLKKIGIEYIESMGGGLWSDLNDHDPGVTFLEMLSYAISDLGARLEMPIEDILASKTDPQWTKQFYRAEEILPMCPVTELDYRKLFLDIPGIRNCWIQPYDQSIYVNCTDKTRSYDLAILTANYKEVKLQGLNCVIVDLEEGTGLEVVEPLIRELYNANRNLCEDLVEVKEVCQHPISICTKIELHRNADENLVHAQILDAIEAYFSSEIHRYSLKEMLDKGYRTDEIFEGPLLEKGFIDSVELGEAGIRSEVRLSDLVNIIMDIEGVKVIPEITMQDCHEHKDGTDWIICLKPSCKPILVPSGGFSVLLNEPGKGETKIPLLDCTLSSVFNYVKDVIPTPFDPITVQEIRDEIQVANELQNTLTSLDNRLTFSLGQYSDIGETTTIQNDFPETYGIGPYGLPASASGERRAKALQLKGYLLFFDQILASYFAHLDKVKDLFSFDNSTAPTYFTQAVKDLKGIDNLTNNYPQMDDVALSDALMSGLDDSVDRRNEVLDHLLARFAEQFSEYSFLMKQLYGIGADLAIIDSKEQFLQEYVEISGGRAKGMNCGFEQPYWDTDNISGAQKRIARLVGIKNYDRRFLYRSNVQINENSGVFTWTISTDGINPIIEGDGTTSSIDEALEQICFAVHLFFSVSIADIEAIDPATDINPITGLRIGGILITNPGVGDFYFKAVHYPALNSPIPVAISYNGTFATWEETKADLIAIINHIQTNFVEEGMFLVEHIMLRPEFDPPVGSTVDPFFPVCEDDCLDDCSLDPYSFRVSIVMPGIGPRFSNPDFREFMEKTIQTELPSHIIPKICWVGFRNGSEEADTCELSRFESSYHTFLEHKVGGLYDPAVNAELIDSLIHLNTIYPSGRLHDCKDADFSDSILLGRTNLGTTQ
ncbi:MAG: hypothetical protein QNK23_13935 [Crocinitomicaceae bacterium]|nr:hypothetical protein [Crocinitomicaceae bacterium]